MFIVEKMSDKYPGLDNYSSLVLLPSKNVALWKKWLVQLTVETIMQCFPLRRSSYVCGQQKSFLCSSIVLDRRLLKIDSSVLKLIKLTIPLLPQGPYVTLGFLSLQAYGGRETLVCGTVLIFFYYHCLLTIRPSVNTVKQASNSLRCK